jgi:hypothetical protein
MSESDLGEMRFDAHDEFENRKIDESSVIGVAKAGLF